MKIAILNCYLQGGHTETAEVEAERRFQAVAESLKIEARVFGKSEDIYSFNPDFVIAHSYQDPKLTAYPTYGIMTMPSAWVRNQTRFLRNILSYDGYWTISESVKSFLSTLLMKTQKESFFSYSAMSIGKTKFFPLDFSKAHGAYIGTNWDKTRHQDLFLNFSQRESLKCYGPRNSWAHLPPSLYGGEVPFDGNSLLATYRQAGVGICINHQDFDREEISTARLFEIPAAGAVMIASKYSLARRIFGEGILSVNTNSSSQLLAEEIHENIMWVKDNPKISQEMAEYCHYLFCENLSMEKLLLNGIEAHYNFLNKW